MILITTVTTIRKWVGNDHQLQFANATNSHKEQTAKSSQNTFCFIIFVFTFCLTTQSIHSLCLTPLQAMPAAYAFSARPCWQHTSACWQGSSLQTWMSAPFRHQPHYILLQVPSPSVHAYVVCLLPWTFRWQLHGYCRVFPQRRSRNPNGRYCWTP